MKWILSLLLVLSFSAHAEKMDDEQRAAKFAERKAKAIGELEKRIDALNTLKSCISSASDRDALRDCRKAHKETAKSFRKAKGKWKGKRKGKNKSE